MTACERVLVVIPAWNEEHNLGEVVAELRRERSGDDILVVDDGSTDGTPRVARALGCHVLELPFHLGYGAAIQAGLKYGRRREYSIVVTFDGDGQHDPADIEPIVRAVRQGADLALGSRFLASHSYQGGLLRRAGRRLFSTLARALTGLRLTDPTSGLKALGERGQTLFALARFPDRFPDADALVLVGRAHLLMVECPARMRPSQNHHSMHQGLGTVAYTFNMLFSLLVAAMGRQVDLRG